MKYLSIFFIGMLSIFCACENDDNNNDSSNIPTCIQVKIDTIMAQEVRNPPAKVYSYQFNGNEVYFFPQFCCDFPSEVYDANCNFMCSPDGGITGGGDFQCPTFFNTATNGTLIWEDDRE